MARVELIAECSTNHGGSIPLAKEFIHRFADAGATYVKFQTTRVKHLNPADPQYAWFAQSELSEEAHHELKWECEAAGVQFLTTVFHRDELALVRALGCAVVKIGSGEGDDWDLIVEARGMFARVISSAHWTRSDPFHHTMVCVTRYPASERACLAAIDRMRQGPFFEYSDHGNGLDMARWAIECGAKIVEKHVQLPNQARVCKSYEATVAEFKALRQFADDDPSKYTNRWKYA